MEKTELYLSQQLKKHYSAMHVSANNENIAEEQRREKMQNSTLKCQEHVICTGNGRAPLPQPSLPARRGLGRPSVTTGQLRGPFLHQQISGYYHLGGLLTLRTRGEE